MPPSKPQHNLHVHKVLGVVLNHKRVTLAELDKHMAKPAATRPFMERVDRTLELRNDIESFCRTGIRNTSGDADERLERLRDVMATENLDSAVGHGNIERARELLAAVEEDKETFELQDLLQQEIREGNLEMVKVMLKSGVPPFRRLRQDRDEYRLGAQQTLATAIDSGHLDVVKLMVKHGADVLVPDFSEMSVTYPLQMAVKAKKFAICKVRRID
jgi:ankyrin repeat protein